MSCNHCPVMPVVPAAEPDYVLLSMPQVSTRDKVVAHLRAAGASCDLTELGVKLWCRAGGVDWRATVGMLAAAMGRAERKQTRVAVVPRSDNSMALHAAVFGASTVAHVIGELSRVDQTAARAA